MSSQPSSFKRFLGNGTLRHFSFDQSSYESLQARKVSSEYVRLQSSLSDTHLRIADASSHESIGLVITVQRLLNNLSRMSRYEHIEVESEVGAAQGSALV